MDQQNLSFLFIPDITGFTQFVTETEIQHGQHIISELLQIIVNANYINLEVSEIEGDAVLFYKHQSIPSFDEVINQAKDIFIAFHNHLRLYESQRICECGACTNTSTLSLKMIAHVGEIGFTRVLDREKPYGVELVFVHKLLKNNVPQKEYLLFSDAVIKYYGEEISHPENWVTFHNGATEYDKLGSVSYRYISLKPLFEQVKDPPPAEPPARVKNPSVREVMINQPLFYVFEMVLNLDLRLHWNKKIKELNYDKDKLNRIGTKHRCLFDTGFADFETITSNFGKDKLVYGERLLKFPFARELSVYYILSQEGSSTRVRMEIHFVPLPIIGVILKLAMLPKLNREFGKLLLSLKEVCENNPEIPYQEVS